MNSIYFFPKITNFLYLIYRSRLAYEYLIAIIYREIVNNAGFGDSRHILVSRIFLYNLKSIKLPIFCVSFYIFIFTSAIDEWVLYLTVITFGYCLYRYFSKVIAENIFLVLNFTQYGYYYNLMCRSIFVNVQLLNLTYWSKYFYNFDYLLAIVFTSIYTVCFFSNYRFFKYSKNVLYQFFCVTVHFLREVIISFYFRFICIYAVYKKYFNFWYGGDTRLFIHTRLNKSITRNKMLKIVYPIRYFLFTYFRVIINNNSKIGITKKFSFGRIARV